MKLVKITEAYDQALAEIIRGNLKSHQLDIPGTAYFDPELDHLTRCYLANPKSVYYVALDAHHQVVGGIGLSDFPGLEKCAELQKLYLDDRVKGHGYGYVLIAFIRQKAIEMGYRRIYLETHHHLKAAIHIYEKMGFQRIDRLPECVHDTMDLFFLLEL